MLTREDLAQDEANNWYTQLTNLFLWRGALHLCGYFLSVDIGGKKNGVTNSLIHTYCAFKNILKLIQTGLFANLDISKVN